MLAARNAARQAELNRRIILNPRGLEEVGAMDLMQLSSMALEAIRDQLPLLPAPPLRYHTPAELQLQCARGDKLENYELDEDDEGPEGLQRVLLPKYYNRDGLFSTTPGEVPSDLPRDDGFSTFTFESGSEARLAELTPYPAKKAIEDTLYCGSLLDDWDFPDLHRFVTAKVKAITGFGRDSLETATLSRAAEEIVSGAIAECQVYARPPLLTASAAGFLLLLRQRDTLPAGDKLPVPLLMEKACEEVARRRVPNGPTRFFKPLFQKTMALMVCDYLNRSCKDAKFTYSPDHEQYKELIEEYGDTHTVCKHFKGYGNLLVKPETAKATMERVDACSGLPAFAHTRVAASLGSLTHKRLLALEADEPDTAPRKFKRSRLNV